MAVIINFNRPGKGITRYVEGLVDDNPIRLKTISDLSPEFSKRWCEENWWQNGYLPQGTLVGSVVKYLFYREWYSVMQLVGATGETLGYYVDIDTPLLHNEGEYYLTDLFLDLWIDREGMYIELDRDEFDQAYQGGLISTEQHKQADQVLRRIIDEVKSGQFFLQLI
jgi:hypothetical protein